jgi:sulfur-oxidizing protein SoxX
MRGEEKMELKYSHIVPAGIFAGTFGAILLSAVLFGMNAVSAAPSEGQQLAFNRSKGNCVTCHAIKGYSDPGNVAPELSDMKKRFPDRKELVAIISDETKRVEETVMPPFKRNLILTDKEIDAIVDFLYTL